MPNNAAINNNLDEIKQIFVTECAEGLDVIESGLLDLEKGDDTLDTINDIFRGAHSIKGGAATFGYTDIAEFTHAMETLLDKLRGQELVISPPLVQLFLESVDCLREMVDSMDEEAIFDKDRAVSLKNRLNEWLMKDPATQSENTDNEQNAENTETETGLNIWQINFKPKPDFLKNGNQPQHIFRALSELGKVQLKPFYDCIPEFKKIEVEQFYLYWEITLESEADEDRVREVFDWVELDADIELKLIKKMKPVVSPEQSGGTAGDQEIRKQEKPQQDRRTQKKESTSIRVDIEKVDAMLNLVGEMVINQAMLTQISRKKECDRELEQGLALLERTTRELQEAVMEIRMLPVSVTFSRFPRLVHDLSAKLNKKVDLVITGEQTELDKTVLEKIGDPLLHLIRNSLDHGIESPEQRKEAGKEEKGMIHLSASHEGGSVVIRVTDDGAGLNKEKITTKAMEKGLIDADHKLSDAQLFDLIFHPGFSTADEVTDVSGRGVGMDVVRSNIEEIGGRVDVYSENGNGTTFQISLPLTLAILDGQLIRVAGETYVLPLLSIVETVQVRPDRINVLSGREVIYRLRGKAIPVIDMRSVCRIPGSEPLKNYENKQLIIVEADRKTVGLVVDELLDQHQVVIKSLETNFVRIPGMLGATILGDGTVSLILDVITMNETLIEKDKSQITH